MQGGRGGGNPFLGFGDPFTGFGGSGGFGGQSNMLTNLIGGRDPFDDPFFARPFGGMLGPSMFGSSMFGPSMFGPSLFGSSGSPFPNMPSGFIENQVPRSNRSTGPIIEEINPDEDNDESNKDTENPRKHERSSKEPYVEVPDDETEARRNNHRRSVNGCNRLNLYQAQQPQAQGFTFQSSSVTYGGPNGAYYTSSRTKRTGSDGVIFDESKEADTTSGEATHRISRGIHHKGHSTTRKLNADGKVNTMQTLHNLIEDELPGFEEAWDGNASRHLPDWDARLNHRDNIGSGSTGRREPNQGGWALTSTKPSKQTKRMRTDRGDGAGSSHTQKQNVRIQEL